MATEPAPGIDAISQLEQAVLLGVVILHQADETPVDTHEIGRTCRKEIAEGSDRLGTIREADVIRSLYRLEDEDLVEEIDANRTSPTGKGRPAYELAVDPDAVYEAVDEALLGD
ncbi:hypothetical protein SAMN05444422_101194 [Halobiforma haloterrestris]|uniref:Uncharacterized protein n=1 Tax=Natronobacterium haloterrestre TaxID=148448 RepID=A0A1I1D7V6_NATHA|nr:hypothetical protein [Halobiforma haloterrestris]SFB68900.1 hypothetical protein SAMN05444422_101194 [Halobiforma haloterrestris]